jgi:hypothetical protein
VAVFAAPAVSADAVSEPKATGISNTVAKTAQRTLKMVCFFVLKNFICFTFAFIFMFIYI